MKESRLGTQESKSEDFVAKHGNKKNNRNQRIQNKGTPRGKMFHL